MTTLHNSLSNAAASTAPAPAASGLSALTVLVVDDDSFMLELLGSMLRQLGVTRVTVAADGQRGIAAFDQAVLPPDVVICDINMPGKDGFEVMEHIGLGGYRGGVILLSGMNSRVLNSAALMGRFHHLDVLAVLTKPAPRLALRDALAKAASTLHPSRR